MGAGAMLWLYLSASLDGAGKLFRKSVRCAVPAMWLAPGLLLVSSASPPAVAAGVLLIANSVRLLVRGVAPDVCSGWQRHEKSSARLFRYATRKNVFARETVPVIAAAVAFQASLAFLPAGYPLAAACLLAGSVTVWNWRFVNAGTARAVREYKAGRTLLSAVLTMILSVTLSVTQVGGFTEKGSDVRSVAQTVWQRVAFGQPQAGGTAREETRQQRSRLRLLIPAKDLVPGVILRPESKGRRSATLAAVASHPFSVSVSRPLEFPFTGEYHLFPAKSLRVQRDSAVYSGTPLDALFMNTSGGPVETQAVQEFRPFIDFTDCGTIQITVVNGERSLGSVSVQLLTNAGAEELKSEIFGFEPGPEEMLDFEVPSASRGGLVRGMRIRFRQVDPSRRSRSAKVAVKAFRLLPRV
jgi:hypothetical protein